VTPPGTEGPPKGESSTARARVERSLERLLITAVGLCVALMAIGLALAVVQGEGLPHDVVGVPDLLGAAARGEPAAYLTLGLLVLLATPVLRVAGALVVFALERDRRYVLVTAAVLAVMGISVLLGRG
jgi:uncharacterized membrane protein